MGMAWPIIAGTFFQRGKRTKKRNWFLVFWFQFSSFVVSRPLLLLWVVGGPSVLDSLPNFSAHPSCLHRPRRPAHLSGCSTHAVCWTRSSKEGCCVFSCCALSWRRWRHQETVRVLRTAARGVLVSCTVFTS